MLLGWRPLSMSRLHRWNADTQLLEYILIDHAIR
jgi:hypothetical protein